MNLQNCIKYFPPICSVINATSLFQSALFPLLSIFKQFKYFTSVGFPGRLPSIIMFPSTLVRDCVGRSLVACTTFVVLLNAFKTIRQGMSDRRRLFQCNPSPNLNFRVNSSLLLFSLLATSSFPHVHELIVIPVVLHPMLPVFVSSFTVENRTPWHPVFAHVFSWNVGYNVRFPSCRYYTIIVWIYVCLSCQTLITGSSTLFLSFLRSPLSEKRQVITWTTVLIYVPIRTMILYKLILSVLISTVLFVLRHKTFTR